MQTDEIRQKHIAQQDANVWKKIVVNRPERKPWKMQCVGCRHADIHVVCNDRPNMWGTPWGTHAANELSIYCYKLLRIVKFPYERCKLREERPKITLDKW